MSKQIPVMSLIVCEHFNQKRTRLQNPITQIEVAIRAAGKHPGVENARDLGTGFMVFKIRRGSWHTIKYGDMKPRGFSIRPNNRRLTEGHYSFVKDWVVMHDDDFESIANGGSFDWDMTVSL